MARPIEIKYAKLLLVEGADALYFCIWACTAFGVQDVQVLDFGGITDLPQFLQLLTLSSGYEQVTTIVIARDAERDPVAAVNSVQFALQRVALPVPERAFEFVGDAPRVAFMLFPGFAAAGADSPALLPGALEDLCLEIVKDTALFECVDLYLQCLQDRGVYIARPHKSRLHTYLSGNHAWVGLKIGEAAKAGAWDWTHPRLQRFKDIITAM